MSLAKYIKKNICEKYNLKPSQLRVRKKGKNILTQVPPGCPGLDEFIKDKIKNYDELSDSTNYN